MLINILPIIAALGVAATLVFIATNSERSFKGAWMLPALLCAAFIGWSLFAIINEGPTGFWTEHTRNLWGVQIWFDLLLAISVAFAAVARPAKQLGMNLLGWAFLILASGSIGLLAMFARFLYLRDKVQSS